MSSGRLPTCDGGEPVRSVAVESSTAYRHTSASTLLTAFLLIGAFAVPALGSLAARAQAQEAPPLCFGRQPTIVGTKRDDEINGTDGDDVIVGLGGNDV